MLDYSKLLSSNDIIFGVTEYQSNTKIQKFIHYSTFGKRPHETNPGTLVKRDLYLQNKMLEGYRSGVDIEWRDRIKSLFNKWVTPSQIYLSYNALPKSLYKFLWKMFVYQLHSVPLKIQQNTKAAVGIIVLLMLSLILSRWNYLVGWESPLYLPHITKITLMTFNLFFVFIIILRRISSKALIGLSEPVIKKILIWLVVSSILFISYKWNAVVAGWMESSRFYIPHLTKTMILLLFLGLLFYRGIFFPLKNGVNKNNVFPLSFFGIGFVGAIGDLAKIPGFLLGAISYTFLGLKK